MYSSIFILYLSIIVGAGCFFVNLYTSLVDARSWGVDIPRSIETARQYTRDYSPATFFKVFGPVNLILAICVLILFWNEKGGGLRWYAGAAVLMYALADVYTVLYFFPRNDIMFRTGYLTDTALLTKAWRQWSRANWLRSAILLLGLCCSAFTLFLLHYIYPIK